MFYGEIIIPVNTAKAKPKIKDSMFTTSKVGK